MAKFKKGDRVQLGAGWLTASGRHSNQHEKRGTAIAIRNDVLVRVKWDERKTIERYHEDFLEIAEVPA